MIVRQLLFVWSILALAGMVSAGANAQSQPAQAGAPQATAPGQAPAPAQPAAGPKIDTAEIIKRADKSTGVDIDSKIKYWQIALDRIEEALRKPGLRYPDLNTFRDDLLKLRADGEEFWRRLEPPLNAAEAQVQKLQPPPAQ